MTTSYREVVVGSGCESGTTTTTSAENPFPITTTDPNSLGELMRGAIILQGDGDAFPYDPSTFVSEK